MVNLDRLDVDITTACQNNCIACSHLTPLQAPWKADPATVERDLANAARVCHFESCTIVGGEPTLNPQAVDFLKIIRASGIADRVLVTTNGQNSERWPDALYQEADHIVITPYKLSEDERNHISRKCKEFGTTLEWHWVGFQTYVYRKPEPARGARLWRHCWYRDHRQSIYEGYLYRCCAALWIPGTLLGLPRETDAIALDGVTEEQFAAWFKREEVLASCAVCASNQGTPIGWRELPKSATKQEWLDASLG